MNSNKIYIDLMLGRGNIYQNIAKFLKLDNGDGYKKVASLVRSNKAINSCFTSEFFPCNIDIGYRSYVEFLPLDKIVLWYSNLLFAFKDELVDILNHKSKIESSILTAKYTEALSICDEVKKTYGLSLWLLDCYSLIKTNHTIEHNIDEKFDNESLFLFQLVESKNTLAESEAQYSNRIDYMFRGVDEDLSCFWKYILFSKLPTTLDEADGKNAWKNILAYVGRYSLIDIYLTTLDYIQYACSRDISNKHLRSSIDVLSAIDCETTVILGKIQNKTDIKDITSKTASDLMQKLEEHSYIDILQMLNIEDDYSLSSFAFCRYIATAAFHAKETIKIEDCLLKDILNCIITSFEKNDYEDVRKAVNNLQRLARILRFFSIQRGMCSFINTEFNIFYGFGFISQFSNYIDHSLICNEYIHCANEIIPYVALVNDFDDDTCKEHVTKIALCIENGQDNNYYYNGLIKAKSLLLERENNISDLIKLIAQYIYKIPFILHTLHVDKIREFLNNKIDDCNDIFLEEVCYIFNDYFFEEYRKACFLNNLSTEGIVEPLEIIKKNEYDDSLKEYYLYKICSIEMINSIYLVFSNSQQVQDYRVKICRWLIDNGSIYAKDAKREIEELEKSKILRHKLINVDKSRISIDSSNIKREAFEKLEFQIDSINNQLYKKVNSLGGKSVVLMDSTSPSDCRDLYTSFARIFCFGAEGLDTSLSTRVRHGVFANQLLKIYNDFSIIHNDISSNEFISNAFEKSFLSLDAKPTIEKLNEDIQGVLKHFTQNILKVYIDEPIEDAVFNFEANDDIIENLRVYLMLLSIMEQKNRVNAIIAHLHQELIKRAQDYLKCIRDIHLPELKDTLVELLDRFRKNINPLVKNVEFKKDINKRITGCNTAIQKEFETLKTWFYLSEGEEWDEYTPKELLDICTEINKKLFSSFLDINVSNNCNVNLKFKGDTFGFCVDMLLILHNNAITHSGYDENLSDLSLMTDIFQTESHIVIKVTNNVSDTIDESTLLEKIKKINLDYNDKVYNQINTRTEGGMGLYKTMNIIHRKISGDNSFYISHDEHKVTVTIKLDKKGVCINEDTVC